MTQNTQDWGSNRRSGPLTLEADYDDHIAWYRRPIIILALVGALIAAGAAIFIGGGGAGIDTLTTGTVEQGADLPEGAQFDGM